MPRYIHELEGWPAFRWDRDRIGDQLVLVSRRQGRFIGRMEALGLKLREEAVLSAMTEEAVKSNEIEGEVLSRDQVRSSLARRLGMDAAGLPAADRNVEGVVEMMLDATQGYAAPLTADRLFAWHSALFPTGRSGLGRVTVGRWRPETSGSMQVVSGPLGRETVHFEAPSSDRLDQEMSAFLAWFDGPDEIDPVLKAAVAHLWFVTVHPFDDGNGRVARAIAELALARSEGSTQRFYSMSAQIRLERDDYYRVLERTQKGDLDISAWLEWFLGCLDRALKAAEEMLAGVLRKARFWDALAEEPLNERQRRMLNRLLDGFDGKLTSSKWAALMKTSQDTASRDIEDLLRRRILLKDPAGGRSTSYSLAPE